jgi:hypothetical protein
MHLQLNPSNTEVMAYVSSRLDYCNAILAGLPESSTVPLQQVQNAAARVILAIGPLLVMFIIVTFRHSL